MDKRKCSKSIRNDVVNDQIRRGIQEAVARQMQVVRIALAGGKAELISEGGMWRKSTSLKAPQALLSSTRDRLFYSCSSSNKHVLTSGISTRLKNGHGPTVVCAGLAVEEVLARAYFAKRPTQSRPTV